MNTSSFSKPSSPRDKAKTVVAYTIYHVILVAVLWAMPTLLLAQTDSLKTRPEPTRMLTEVRINGYRPAFGQSLPDVQGTYLLAGKRSEVIQLADVDANVAEKTARQVFARIPGLFVYDMDGTGNQINIATRGLDPHRSWEINSRQNGILINSDLYGYPASHYSPPMESIGRIELVRGTASLQYGPQFGGMLNYVTKQADTTRRFGFENVSSAGSYGLISSYNAVGGRLGKWTYYAYYYRRHSDGFRQNSTSDADAQLVRLQYQVSKRLGFTAEVGRSAYVYQIPGPLTDSLFRRNPRQATRNRNYFNPDIWVPSLKLDWQLSDRTRLAWAVSAVLGQRNSVQFDALVTIPDVIDPGTGRHKPRQVDSDRFNSLTSELKLMHSYRLGSVNATAVLGLQVLNNDLHRQQLGVGTTGSDFDLTVVGDWGRDLHFRTKNGSFFVESQFYLNSRLTVSPGFRVEHGETRMRGTIRNYDAGKIPNDISHHFPLVGVSAQYLLTPDLKLYGGWSQAYRPVIFKDIIPTSVYERVDKNLKDASGYNAEIGISGQWKGISLNVSLFDLLYRNRLGSLVLSDANGQTSLFRTNTGDSRNRGVEMLLETQFVHRGSFRLSGFTSTAWIDARYRNARISTGADNASIDGNRVESVPRWTSRNGLVIRYRTFSGTLLYSYVGDTFSDALNTPVAPASGIKGPVPAYSLWDVNMTLRLSSAVAVRGSINNVLNRSYFTKRPTFYPGPGIWPSDGRSAVVTVSMNL